MRCVRARIMRARDLRTTYYMHRARPGRARTFSHTHNGSNGVSGRIAVQCGGVTAYPLMGPMVQIAQWGKLCEVGGTN